MEKRGLQKRRKGRWKEEAEINECKEYVKNFVFDEINAMGIGGLGYAY